MNNSNVEGGIRGRLSGLLKATTDNTTELLDANTLALNLGAGLVLLVGGDADNSAIDLPAADVDDELVEGVAAHVEPGLEVLGGDGAESLADLDGDADADEFLKAGDVGGQIGVEVVGVEGRPELGVLGGLEEGVEAGELLHGLDEVGGLASGLGFAGGGEGLGVCWEEGEAEREGRGGEDGQGLGQDVGHGVGLEEVRVELEAGLGNNIVSNGFSTFERDISRIVCHADCRWHCFFTVSSQNFSTFPSILWDCQVIGNA